MLTNKLAMVTAIAFAGPAAAFEHLRTELSLGYEDYSIEDVTIDGPFAGVKTDFGFSDTFGLQANLSYGERTFESSSVPLETTTIGLHPYYDFGGAFRAGIFLQHTKLEEGNSSADIEAYGIEGIFNPLPNLALEGYVGAGRIDQVFDEIDLRTIGMKATYGFTPQMAGRFSAEFDTLDSSGSMGGGDVQFSNYILGFDYHFGGAGSAVPVVLSAEIGQFDDGNVFDRMAIKLTVPLGGGSDTGGRRLYGDRSVVAQYLVPTP
jgi:hypothetical protein